MSILTFERFSHIKWIFYDEITINFEWRDLISLHSDINSVSEKNVIFILLIEVYKNKIICE